MKEHYDHSLLLKNLPKEFHDILKHIKSLTYSDKPNYKVRNTSVYWLRSGVQSMEQ